MKTPLPSACRSWLDTRTGSDWSSVADVQLPDLHTIHQATIINAFHDGIFVKIPGYEVDGLVHHSQISRQLNMDNSIPKVERYKQITGVIGEVNTQVWVKVVYVAKTEHLKCECSLKMVRPAFECPAFLQTMCSLSQAFCFGKCKH